MPLHASAVPSLYLAHYLDEFEELIEGYAVRAEHYRPGEQLIRPGVINNTAFYILSGLFRLSLRHDQGEKALNIFGPGTVFPVGVELHEDWMEFEMVIQALTDLQVYAMPYPELKRIVVDNGRFAGELLRENCDFMGYLFMDSVNQAFEPCLVRLADVLYLYVTMVKPTSNVVMLSQLELAKFVGGSKAQFERSIQFLRRDGVIDTARGRVIVLDRSSLLEHCSLGLRMNI